MSAQSVLVALTEKLAGASDWMTVSRGDTEPIVGGTSAIIPDPERCPFLRILRGRMTERGMTLSGLRERRMRYQCEVWDYFPADADPASAEPMANLFLDRVDACQQAIRSDPQLGGSADTASTQLLQIKVIDDTPITRPFVRDTQAGLRSAWSVEAWEKDT